MEKSRRPEDLGRVLTALSAWLQDPAQAELRRSFTAWLRQVLLPARMPGVVIPELADLEEVKSMLAERVVEWTREWKQEGFEKGLEEGLEKGREKGREEGLERALADVRAALTLELEKRFGPLSEEARRRVQELDSFPRIVELSTRVATASSLAALGLS